MAATAVILDLIGMILAIFIVYKSPQYFQPSFESVGLLVQRRSSKINIWSDLAIFNLQVIPILPIKSPVDWPRGLGDVI